MFTNDNLKRDISGILFNCINELPDWFLNKYLIQCLPFPIIKFLTLKKIYPFKLFVEYISNYINII